MATPQTMATCQSPLCARKDGGVDGTAAQEDQEVRSQCFRQALLRQGRLIVAHDGTFSVVRSGPDRLPTYRFDL